MSSTNTTSQTTAQTVLSLPWVTYCGPIADTPIGGRDSTHRIETDISELQWTREIAELQNLGVQIDSVSTTGTTARLYVTLSDTVQ